jgi:hypothetical protein
MALRLACQPISESKKKIESFVFMKIHCIPLKTFSFHVQTSKFGAIAEIAELC